MTIQTNHKEEVAILISLNMSDKNDDEGSCHSYVKQDMEPNDIPKSIITTTPIKVQKKSKKKKRKHSSTGGADGDTASSLVTDSLVSSGSKKKKRKKDKKRKSKDRASSAIDDWQPPAGLPPEVDNSQQQEQLSSPSTDQILKLASQKLSQHQQQTFGSIFSLIAKPTTANNQKLKKSPYQVKTILGTVALLPTSLPDVPKCIKSLLQTLLLMYDSNMGGVLLSLEDDIKLLPVDYKATSSSRGSGSSNNRNSGLIGGRIVDDLPYVHYKFQMNGLLFSPTLNMKLTGQVIECTQTYITLTTHHIVSTKISTEKLQEVGFYYNETSFEWEKRKVGKDNDNDTLVGPLTTICLDDRVDFIVERIHECGGYISLDGMRPEVSTLG